MARPIISQNVEERKAPWLQRLSSQTIENGDNQSAACTYDTTLDGFRDSSKFSRGTRTLAGAVPCCRRPDVRNYTRTNSVRPPTVSSVQPPLKQTVAGVSYTAFRACMHETNMAAPLYVHQNLPTAVSQSASVSSTSARERHRDATHCCRRLRHSATTASVTVPLRQLVAAAALGSLIPTVLCAVSITLQLGSDGVLQDPPTLCCHCCVVDELMAPEPLDYQVSL
jgi:hypothetical protein